MIKLLKYLKTKEWLLVALCAVFIFAQVWLDLKIPDYMQEITVLVQTEGSLMADVWHAGLMMMLCALGSLVTAIVVCFIGAKISATISFRLKKAVYDKVESFSMEEINKFSTSSLITRSTNDITQVQLFTFLAMQVLIKAPILAIWAVFKIADKGWEWSLATISAVCLLVIILVIVMAFAIPKFKKMQRLTDNINKVTRENLTGVRVVRAFNAESYQEQKFEKANEELTNTQLFTGKLMAVLLPAMTLIMDGLMLAIYWIGAFLIDSASQIDKLTIFADMIVYTSYAMQIVMAFMMLIMVFMIMPRASVSANRINEVLNTKPNIVDGTYDSSNNDIRGEIEFKNVSFKYPDADEYILENVSFKVEKGETVAFIGSTVSGKSTLINLIPRFYDATDGVVLIDGVNVKDYNQKDLHNKIGYVAQKAVIFSGSISSNINFGENDKGEMTAQDIEKSANIAQASSFIESMPGKYDSNIAQSGTNLSGGQKQRLAIARAIARNPEILVFDDSFSALDYKTDKVLREELNRQTKDITKVIVAQRIGTIIDADKIVVLDSGKIVGVGKHSELIEKCEVYKEIALSQLSKEELENA
ncbi:MAG: ABC transporter ATP-binding protein [Clostridia bacterium]|nr:ABC transporter ATP-binding protein [Clostridia bacterium]